MIDEEFSVPEMTWNRLFPYQRDGVSWLWKMHKRGEGCILAVDDSFDDYFSLFLCGCAYVSMI